MNNKLFVAVGNQIRTTFGFVPAIKGTQGTALGSISEHFVGIGNIMAEGKVLPEHAELALSKLYEAKLAVDAAVAYGWNGGAPAQY